MTGTPTRKPRRKSKEDEREAWQLLREKWLYALATALTLGLFITNVALGRSIESLVPWLAFLAGLFGVGVAASLDKRERK